MVPSAHKPASQLASKDQDVSATDGPTNTAQERTQQCVYAFLQEAHMSPQASSLVLSGWCWEQPL